MENLEYIWISTQEQLTEAVNALQKCEWVSIDLEADNQHLYDERVCLFQCSTNDKNYLIDTLAIQDMSEFIAFLENDSVLKLFHDLEFDLKIINKEFKCKPKKLWDTKLAAELCNEPKVSLSAILQKYLEINPDKTHQKGNWTIRPILPEMIQYSIMDSLYLKQLKDIFEPKLIENNRISWFEEEIQIKENTFFQEPNIPEYLRIKDNERLKGIKLNLLNHLCVIRNNIAKANEISRFQIASNKNLLQICQSYPQKISKKNLDKILRNKLSEEFIFYYFEAFLKVKREAPIKRSGSDIKPVQFQKSNTQTVKDWRNKTSETMQIPPNLILSNETIGFIVADHKNIKGIEDLAKIQGVRKWQIETFGLELIKKVLIKLK